MSGCRYKIHKSASDFDRDLMREQRLHDKQLVLDVDDHNLRLDADREV